MAPEGRQPNLHTHPVVQVWVVKEEACLEPAQADRNPMATFLALILVWNFCLCHWQCACPNYAFPCPVAQSISSDMTPEPELSGAKDRLPLLRVARKIDSKANSGSKPLHRFFLNLETKFLYCESMSTHPFYPRESTTTAPLKCPVAHDWRQRLTKQSRSIALYYPTDHDRAA